MRKTASALIGLSVALSGGVAVAQGLSAAQPVSKDSIVEALSSAQPAPKLNAVPAGQISDSLSSPFASTPAALSATPSVVQDTAMTAPTRPGSASALPVPNEVAMALSSLGSGQPAPAAAGGLAAEKPQALPHASGFTPPLGFSSASQGRTGIDALTPAYSGPRLGGR